MFQRVPKSRQWKNRGSWTGGKQNWRRKKKVLDKKEILDIIENLKNFNSPGKDGLLAQLYKHGSKNLLEEITNLI